VAAPGIFSWGRGAKARTHGEREPIQGLGAKLLRDPGARAARAKMRSFRSKEGGQVSPAPPSSLLRNEVAFY